MLLFEVLKIDELLGFPLPIHDFLVYQFCGRRFAPLSNLLQAVQLDHSTTHLFWLHIHIVPLQLAFVSLLLKFAEVGHLDQQLVEFVPCKSVEYGRALTFVQLLALSAGFRQVL